MIDPASRADFATHPTGDAQQDVRIRRNLDSGWKFLKGNAKNAEDPAHDDVTWRNLDLPHDWSIEGTFSKKNAGGERGGYVELGMGWYRKTFTLPLEHRKKKVLVQFDGIYKDSDVWFNGQHVGRRWNGYVSFQYDLTPHVKWDGPNVLAVRVNNPKQTCRWYSGSGIYRHVWLTVTDKLHVGHWGTAVTTPSVSKKSAAVKVKTLIQNEYDTPKACTLITEECQVLPEY